MSDDYPTPTPPSTDPRWDNTYVKRWRTDAAKHRERQSVQTAETNVAALMEYLKHDVGVTQITEDLVYILWTTIPLISTFIHARISHTCQHPQTCGVASLGHAIDGLEFGAAALLELENKIGEVLI